MKNIIFIIAITGILGACLYGCQKEGSKGGSSSGTRPELILSKSTVAREEPLVITARGLSSAAFVRWTVLPSLGAKLVTGRAQVTALFGNPGNYQVTATVFADSSAPVPYDSSSYPVTVLDSVYNPPPVIVGDTFSLTGVQVSIQPIEASDSGGLIMYAYTSSTYTCYPGLGYSFTLSTDSMTLDFSEVTTTIGNCNGVNHNAIAAIYTNAHPGPANGAYAFTVILNNTVYTGTLTVTDEYYTFDWKYTSGVTISPLQIVKTKV